jgi:hypothetical protein
MYPVVENGSPRDKETPQIILKAKAFHIVRVEGVEGNTRYFMRYLCQLLNPRI